jgi:hypothetical protein
MKREEIEKIVKLCQDELLIHLNAMVFVDNDYPVRAVAQTTILSLLPLMRTQIDKFLSEQNENANGNQLELLVSLRPLIFEYLVHKKDYDAIVGKIVSEGYGTQIYQALQNAEQKLIEKLIELVGAS